MKSFVPIVHHGGQRAGKVPHPASSTALMWKGPWPPLALGWGTEPFPLLLGQGLWHFSQNEEWTLTTLPHKRDRFWWIIPNRGMRWDGEHSLPLLCTRRCLHCPLAQPPQAAPMPKHLIPTSPSNPRGKWDHPIWSAELLLSHGKWVPQSFPPAL